MKKHIQIKYSYNIWNPKRMRKYIDAYLGDQSASRYLPYILEWWLHNICYYITKPFIKFPKVQAINLRARDVDLDIKIKECKQ